MHFIFIVVFILVVKKESENVTVPATSTTEIGNTSSSRCVTNRAKCVNAAKKSHTVRRKRKSKIFTYLKKVLFCCNIYNFYLTESFLSLLSPEVRQEELTPEAKSFYKQLIHIKKVARVCRKKMSTMERLLVAARFIQHGNWKMLDKLNPVVMRKITKWFNSDVQKYYT